MHDHVVSERTPNRRSRRRAQSQSRCPGAAVDRRGFHSVVHVAAVAVHRLPRLCPSGAESGRHSRPPALEAASIRLPPRSSRPARDASLTRSVIAASGRRTRREGLDLSIGRPQVHIHPRDIGKHRPRMIELGPEIQQHQLVGMNRPRRGRRRQVMRIAGVFGRRDVRIGIAHEIRVREPSRHQPLDVVFRRRHAVAEAARDRVECAILHLVELFGSGLV